MIELYLFQIKVQVSMTRPPPPANGLAAPSSGWPHTAWPPNEPAGGDHWPMVSGHRSNQPMEAAPLTSLQPRHADTSHVRLLLLGDNFY